MTNKKYVKAVCIDCGKKLSKNKYQRCQQCVGKINAKDKDRNSKISISRIGELNPAKREDVRKKISETIKKKYKTGEVTSPFKKGHKINKGRVHGQLYRENRMGEKNAFYGRHHTLETKEKYKEKRKNWVCPKKDTSIEVKIQNFLKELGIEFFTHQHMKEIKHGYQCDIFIPSMNMVIECDGDYWHKYPTGTEIDHIHTKELIEQGFKVLRLWEFEIRLMDLNKFQERLKC